MKKSYPEWLRGVVRDDGRFEEPRKYAQSTSGQSDSHVTLPADSRSMLIASDSAQDLPPYATFLRCPEVVPQREANESRSSDESALQYSSNSMEIVHHTVNKTATPIGEFTKRLRKGDNRAMPTKRLSREEKKKVRIANLQRFMRLYCHDKQAELVEMCDGKPSASFFSDLFKGKKSFGETQASQLEEKLELKEGQLSIPDSPLIRVERTQAEVDLSDLSARDLREVAKLVKKLRERRVG